ncbi:angiomotin-like [Lethenteron reissneri]|uniref:angiomotin-like n=1 Tax=Lethenteron reissneri TaxID=7753 RepID=UPI002AB78169|nr:angiomotin-like [Lethenteron reissneri]
MWRARLENGSSLMISGANANQHGATFTLNSSAHSASLSFERASPSHSGLYSCCVRHGAAANGATAAANGATAAANGATAAANGATAATNGATAAANGAPTSATATAVAATAAVVEQQPDPQQQQEVEEDCRCSFRLHVEEPASSSAHQQSDGSTPNVTTFLAVICSLLAGVGVIAALLFVLLRRYRNCSSVDKATAATKGTATTTTAATTAATATTISTIATSSEHV